MEEKNKFLFQNKFIRKYFKPLKSYNSLYFILFFLIFFISLFPYEYSSKKFQLKELYFDSTIVLKIRGSGNQYIISDEAVAEIPLPNSLVINNINIENINKIQNLSEENNTIIMRWDNQLTTCRNMFKLLNNITEIDLSNFDFSSVTDMRSFFDQCGSVQLINMSNGNAISVQYTDYMFAHCGNLVSLDLTNFKSYSLISMKGMFYGCNHLQTINMDNFKMEQAIDMDEFFAECNSMKSLNLSNFYTPSLINMRKMFFHCYDLEFVDLSNFNTDKVTNMEELFNECHNLTTLDLNNFKTESVQKMNYMFYGCYLIKSLDLKYFYTPNLDEMKGLFTECHSLISLDISNFNTTKISDMQFFFKNCYSIKTINIGNFNTSSVTNMGEMFYNCHDLISLNISNFNTELVESMGNMFYNCNSLKYLNLSHFQTPNLKYIDNMFNLCKSLISLDISNINTERVENMAYFCNSTNSLISLDISKFKISGSNIENFLTYTNPNIILCYNVSEVNSDLLTQISSYINNCSNLCILGPKKFISEINKCVDNCSDEAIYKYQYENECYKECPNFYNYEKTECIDEIPQGYYINNISEKTIDKCPDKCKSCSFESMSYNLCMLCNDNYYIKYNDSSNINGFYECYNEINEEILGYYLDNNIYKPCYYKCKKCLGEGNESNNNCYECNNENFYILEGGNCILKQLETTNIINYFTTNSIMQIDKDITNMLINTQMNYNNTTDSNFNTKEKYENQFYYDITINSEENKKNFSHIYIENNQELIDFLREKFSLDEGDKIFVKISEKEKNDSKTVTLDYIYEFLLENRTILNLSNISEDIYIEIYVPIIEPELAKFDLNKEYAKQGYDIYDKKDIFYTDYCTPASFNDNDITLLDRKNDIYPNNITFCKSNCNYSGVNLEEQRVICLCNLNYNKNIGDDGLEESEDNFISYFLDNINYKIFTCHKLIFNFNNLIHSYSLYIILTIFFISQILNCIFICYTIRRLKIYMGKEMESKIKLINGLISKRNKNNKISNPNRKSIKYKNINIKKNMNKSKTGRNTVILQLNNNNNTFNSHQIVRHSSKNVFSRKSFNKLIIKKEEDKLIVKEEDNENIDELPFSKAIHIDKRNIFIMFYSFLIQKLEIIDIIFSDSKIKIILFKEYILTLLINFFFNALLYSDDVISNKYHNNGELDFFVSLTISLLSNIVTSIFCYYIKYSRGIEERIKYILEIRQPIYCAGNISMFLSVLKIKFIFYFIFQSIVFALCTYYIIIFCILYTKSQISLIINYCFSLIESIIISFVIALIILITRKIGLSFLNKEFYNVSKYINSKF